MNEDYPPCLMIKGGKVWVNPSFNEYKKIMGGDRMIKFVLTGYRRRDDKKSLFLYPQADKSYPVYEAEYISDDLIFGR